MGPGKKSTFLPLSTGVRRQPDLKIPAPSSTPDLQAFDRVFYSRLVDLVRQRFPEISPEKFHQHLRPAIDFFHSICQMSPSHTLFGKQLSQVNPDVRAQIDRLASSFANYVVEVEREMLFLEDKVSYFPEYQKHFPEDSFQRIRSAAYLAFICHYGQERKSEIGPDGQPLPYVTHPIRAAFNVQMRQLGLMSEETLSATLLHDVFEDIDKSFPVVASKVNPRLLKQRLEQFINMHVQPPSSSDRSVVKVTRLMEMVDKKSAEQIFLRSPANRTEVLMALLYHLASLTPDEFQQYVPHVLAIKLSDRADNGSTIQGLNSQRYAAIWLETCFVYLWLAESLDMQSCAEWLRDLLQHVQLDDRKKMETARAQSEDLHDIPTKFCDRMYEEIEKRGFDRKELFIDFRPRGIRGIDIETERDSLLVSNDPRHHGIAFNYFINLVPVCNDPSRILDLGMAIESIIQELFPVNVDGIFDEQKTTFGRQYRYRSDLPGGVVSLDDLSQDQDKFGYAVTRIFTDRSEFIQSFGKLHGAQLLNDRDSRKKLVRLQHTLSSYVEGPIRTIFQIDEASDVNQSLDFGQRRVRRKIKRTLQAEDTVPVRSMIPEERAVLLPSVYASFYCFFASHKQQVSLVNNASSSGKYMSAYLPANAPVIASLLGMDITALLSRPLYAEVERSLVGHDASSARNDKDLWDKDDFGGIIHPEDFAYTPFADDSSAGVLRYQVDRGVADIRPAMFLLARLQELVHEGLNSVVQRSGITGEVPRSVAQIGMDYDQ